MYSKVAFLILLIISVASCKKNDGDSTTNNKTNPPVTITDVYAAGYVGTSHPVAAYWKNGNLVKLSESSSGMATGIAVSGTDIYLVGYSYTATGQSVAAYWKNGVRTYLADSTVNSAANAIAISGNTIYISGYVHSPVSGLALAAYWKNGVVTVLGDATSATLSSAGRAIAIQGSDVYVAGNITGPLGFTAVYWKNGAPISVMGGKPEYYSQLFGINIYGNDIYLSGQIYGSIKAGEAPKFISTYWKNGTPTTFTDQTGLSEAVGVAVPGSDVFVVGELLTSNGTTMAGYWKNGSFIAIGDGIGNSSATTSVVSGSDLYIGGTSSTANYTYANYWKNGKNVHLAESGSGVTSIVVVTK